MFTLSYSAAKTGENGIPSRSGKTLGEAIVTLLRFADDTIAAGDDVVAYNSEELAVSPNKVVGLLKSNGKWFVVAEAIE